MINTIYVNGQFISSDKACLSPLDRGFLYGDGIFETIRVYDRVPFRWNQHIERMTDSARALEINWKEETQKLKDIVSELLKRNNLKNAYLRISVSRGIHTGDLGFDSDHNPTTVIVTDKLKAPSYAEYERGVPATVVQHPWASPMAAHKTLSYLPYLAARHKARKAGMSEALLCDPSGRLTEGTTSNIFLVLRNKVFTPPADGTILGGITRRVALESLKSLNIECEENRVTVEDAARADEIFITNSIIEVLPVTALDKTPVGDGKVGPITKSAMDAYRSEVQKEIETAKKISD